MISSQIHRVYGRLYIVVQLHSPRSGFSHPQDYAIAEFYYNVYDSLIVTIVNDAWLRVVYLLSDRCRCALADKALRK
jgi:hypothetical protein